MTNSDHEQKMQKELEDLFDAVTLEIEERLEQY